MGNSSVILNEPDIHNKYFASRLRFELEAEVNSKIKWPIVIALLYINFLCFKGKTRNERKRN